LEGGPPCFPQTHRGSWYSGDSWLALASPYGSLTLCGGAFQHLRVGSGSRLAVPTTPPLWKEEWFGLVPPRSPLLRESRLISLGRATEMFQFAHCPPVCLCVQQLVSRHHSGRVAPFGFSGLIARMQLPLNVSPVSASFIGLQRLGIHLVLSLACASSAASLLLLLASSALLLFTPSLALLCLFSFCSRLASAKLK
jgi:hypothetical protein